ncbi:MAG: hypothetical protein DSY80_00225 [Desulfocapsa sp.]|nr:MAG: hypothetical protein DSY80_00225 [Desulfocapsa sp.]
MASLNNSPPSSSKRKFLLLFAGCAALYPLFRFLGFTVPKKPRIIEISKPVPLGGFYIGHDFLLFDDGQTTWAVSRRCTHLGCTVNYHEKEKIIECPCHQSRFTAKGVVLHGPAKKNLTRHKVEKLDDGGYIVTI